MTNSLGFIALFNWFEVLRKDLARRHGLRKGFGVDWFVLLGVLACYQGGKGLSVKGLVGYYCACVNGTSFKNVKEKLDAMCRYNYVVKVRRGKFVYYSLSSHAEKLLLKSVGRDALRDMNAYMRDVLKG